MQSDKTTPFFAFAEVPLFAPDAVDQAISRAYVAAGRCPICGDGPFAVVANHTASKHEINRYQLRDMLGVYKTTSICDAGHSAAVSARGRQRFREGKWDADEVRSFRSGKRKLSAAARRAVPQKMNREYVDRMAAMRAARVERFMELGGDFAASEALASEIGLSGKAVRASLRKAGALVPDGRSNTTKQYRPQPVPIELRARCTIAGCDRVHSAKGLCGMHYQRASKRGAAPVSAQATQ